MPQFLPMLQLALPLGEPTSVTGHANGPIPFDMLRIVYSEEVERVLGEFTCVQGV